MATPATLPADFFDKQAGTSGPGRGNAAPDTLPANFFEGKSNKPKLTPRRPKQTLTGREPNQGEDQVARGMRAVEVGGAVLGLEGVAGAGKALLDPALSLAARARPALGLVAGFGTGYGVDRAARALGAPGWVAESIATLAAIEVGGKVGMSPEMAARLKNSGFKGIIERWINGEPKPNEVNEFYRAKYGKLPETGEEILTAKAEASEFKKSVAAKIRNANKMPEPAKPFAPSAGVARKMKFGGAAPESEAGSSAYKQVGMGGAPEPPPKDPVPEPVKKEPFKPFKANPDIKRRMQFGGSGSSESSGRAYRQVGMTGPKVAKPEAGAEAIKSEAESETPKSKPKLKDKVKGAATKGTEPAAEGSSYGFTHPKESLTDVRKQLFSNTQQQKIPNDQVRVRFTQLHGHGISAGTYEEIQQFNEYIARNGKLPDAPSVK